MGNSEARQLHENVKKRCLSLENSLSEFMNNPNNRTKMEFEDCVYEAKNSIEIYIRLEKNDPNVENNLRQILSILTRDLSSMRKYQGSYDFRFYEVAEEALECVNEINRLVVENRQYVRSFGERIKEGLKSFFNWFVVIGKLMYDSMPMIGWR